MAEKGGIRYEIETWPASKGISRKRKGEQWPEPEQIENTLVTASEKGLGRVNPLTVIRRGLGFVASPSELHMVSEALNLRKGVLKSPLLPHENS